MARSIAAPAMPLPPELLKCVEYLTPNAAEASQLTGVTVNDEATARRAAEKLVATGAKYVIVTLGAVGALLASAESMVLVPGVAVNAVDTTAAGDAFNGAIACGLLSGLAALGAVQHACLAAAVSTTRLGAQPSLPTAMELHHFAEVLKRR